ncbi:MAG: GreA/GreB family elongation factor [Candidatus Sumerlaeaceae bacterium]|nr:GreA/GreB family elongation factor [Candidatus Sumerlaeaceae bacterium]
MPETSSPVGDLEERIIELARAGDVAAVEAEWDNIVRQPPDHGDFYRLFIKAMCNKAKVPETAQTLIGVLLEALQERGEWEQLLLVVREAAAIWPNLQDLRKPASAALKGLYGDHPNFKQIIAACKGAPLDVALRRFEAYLTVSPGRVYRHTQFGDGVVQAMDLTAGKVVIDFPTEKGKVFTLAGVRDFLTYFPPDHIVARRATEPETLQALAEENPAALVRLALQGHDGVMKQGELKALLLGAIVPENHWNSWWSRARAEISLDPLIDFNTRAGAHAELRLRDRPKSLEEEIEEVFLDPEATISGRIAATARVAAAIKSGAEVSRTLLVNMLRTTSHMFAVAQKPVDRLQAALLAEEIRAFDPTLAAEVPPVPSPETIAQEITDYAELHEIEQVDYAMRALAMLLRRDGPAGVAQACRILPSAPPKLAQAIWRELDEEHHAAEAVEALRALFDRPLDNPLTYLWAVKGLLEGGWDHLADYIPPVSLVPELLDNLDEWMRVVDMAASKEQVAAAKMLISKTRSLLQANHFAPLVRVVTEVSLDEAQQLRRRVMLHNAFNETFRQNANQQMVMARPELESSTKPSGRTAGAQAAGGGVHFCTRKARERVAHELEVLNTVTIPANAREIEKARSEGDLRENAGYHGARERHALLLREAAELANLLATAREVTADQVSTESIGFGVRFEAENLESGEHETYTVLGRFESDPDRRIIAYHTPFMSQFAGKRVGDEVTVTLPNGSQRRYRVLSIENALIGSEWE